MVILMFLQELEAERLKLIEDVTANKRKMQELEDNLLYKLSSTKGTSVIFVDSCHFLETCNVIYF